ALAIPSLTYSDGTADPERPERDQAQYQQFNRLPKAQKIGKVFVMSHVFNRDGSET
ncbi:jg6100, partial [Pararge aegeria aegeria]